MLLHDGRWEPDSRPKQIVSAERVTEFTRNADFLETATFREPNYAGEKNSNLNYGYLFWNNSRQSRLGAAVPPDAYFMSGWGKQCCVVIPSLDMVVVRLGPMRELNTQPEYYEELFSRIMEAVIDKP